VKENGRSEENGHASNGVSNGNHVGGHEINGNGHKSDTVINIDAS
jgi:hypothetical protein